MNLDVKPMQHLLLWWLALDGGEGFGSDLPADKPVREPLVRAGLIAEEKRVNPGAKSKRPAVHLTLTEAGWAWCQDHMTWPKPWRSPKAGDILRRLLPRMHFFFRQVATTSLGEFIGKTRLESSPLPKPAPVPPPPPALAPPASDLHDTIRAACRAIGNGRDNVRIRLADLRAHLSQVTWGDVAKALWELSDRGELTLYRLDDPREILPADREAAVRTSAGEEKHILYFGGMAS